MDPKKFKDPKEMTIDGSRFIISKIPAVQGQQIYRALMKECKDDGDIAMTYLSEETTVALLEFAAVVKGEEGDEEGIVWESLDSVGKINSECPNTKLLIYLEAAMIRYNFGFLFDGSLQEVLGVLRDSQAI